MDGGAWWATVAESDMTEGVAENQTWLSDWTATTETKLLYPQKPKISCDSLYWNFHFIVVVWNWIYTISQFCLYEFKAFSIFSSIQLLSHVRLFATPWITAHQASLSITNSWTHQTHVHRVGDAIQPSHPLSSPSPPAPNPSQHQGLFQWINSSHEVAKILEFQLQHHSFQWTPRTDLL